MTTEEMQKQIESMMPTPQQIVEHIDKKLEEKREQKYKDACRIIDEIVSEFPESEDEKIRKALIRFHKSTIDVDGIKGEDILAWLEKQVEQKPNWTDEDEKNFNNIDIILFEYKNLPKETYWKIINWIRSIKQRMEE